MDFLITRTAANLSEYPMHSHDVFEIVCYLEGNGVMRSDKENIKFSKGTLLIIPPGCLHGSISEKSFSNVCIHTADCPKFSEKGILIGKDNANEDAQTLAKMLYRYYLDEDLREKELIRNLYNAYLSLVLSLVEEQENSIIAELHKELMNNLWNSHFDLTAEIGRIGYTEDYVRRLYRSRYGKTPLQFLLSARIEYAKKLLYIYGNKVSIREIAEMCGFSDPLYFSRMFKRTEGIGPKAYLSEIKK
ncbi:MAG TPA: AraC family transcriptional regulator [Firmicutes bacterium]|nr:AraC family transcriptional regulator [Bacillota bacterium]